MPPGSNLNAPAKPPVVLPGTGNNIIINPLQRGNLVLECIRNVGKEFGDVVADYQVGRTTGVLFLSLKYHRLHPEYIHTRIEKLGHSYSLRILLILNDISEHRDPIRELTKTCLINNITVIVAFSYDISFEDAGHYLSTFKQFEHKPPDLIKERVDKDYNSILRSSLTSISKVNKTDVETLRTSFGSFSNIAKATSDQLQNLPGFGQIKVKNIKNAFEKPIRNNSTNSLSFTVSQLQSPSPNDQVVAKTQAKGKERPESTLKMSSSSQLPERPPRRASPVWDIEPDSPPSMPTAENGPDPESTSKGPSSPIPTWDIELDLNASEEEDNAQASA